MLDYKLKTYTFKEFEEKTEELVNHIFNVISSYNTEVQTYTENIAQIVQEKKQEVLKELKNIYNQNTFCCVLLVEEKPVAYCICKESANGHWDIFKILTALDMQNKGYEYILEKNCVNQVKINNGKTIN